MQYNTFISETIQEDTSKVIHVILDNRPTLQEQSILEKIFKKKEGGFISKDKRHFKFNSALEGNMLEQYFNEYNLQYICKGISYEKRKALQSDNPESKIVNFGIHKGKCFSQLDSEYLVWLKDNHFDRAIKEIASQILEKRETVYIDMSKYA